MSREQAQEEEVRQELAATSTKFLLMERAKNNSFIFKNKKKSFNKEPDYKHWVHSSINFKGPELDRVKIKLSKEHVSQIKNGNSKTTSVRDFLLNDENEYFKK